MYMCTSYRHTSTCTCVHHIDIQVHVHVCMYIIICVQGCDIARACEGYITSEDTCTCKSYRHTSTCTCVHHIDIQVHVLVCLYDSYRHTCTCTFV